MKVAIIGANGKVGNLILEEALKKGYEVTAIVRDVNKLKTKDKVKVIQKDVFDLTTDDLKDEDVVVSAFAVWDPNSLDKHLTILEHLVSLLKETKTRLIVVGGAGSLYLDKSHTKTLSDLEDFPKEYLQIANAMKKGLDYLRTVKNVSWTYFSPASLFIFDLPKTGEYILGGEEFITNSKGESKIGYADYAEALVEEIANPKHIQERFTIIEK